MDLFPHGLDYAWLAVDAVGHVAMFTNGGQGPIPTAVLADREQSNHAEELIDDLPWRGDDAFPDPRPPTDCYTAFARKGLFAYDWMDVHRAGVDRTLQYELLERPKVPVSVEEMEGAVATLARRVRFEAVRFSESPSIVVWEHVNCILVPLYLLPQEPRALRRRQRRLRGRVAERSDYVLMFARGYPLDQISAFYQVDQRTVVTWIERFRARRIEGLDDTHDLDLPHA
jgi:hypothetical protein